ncbi:MAG TPA: hypothetical protein VFO93_19395 [Hymenobacter sp.]|uniref:hypothetical protein n=1 Tax=Hymenobacter sp. TaxID=1898978 RepID=UPI002D7E2207|nr:hypothetical protein [Hymenobacter sp.]HET9505719.1 hypothetical protein [Hymenobacter sp.]
MSFRAYPAAWPHHTALRAAAARWQRRGLLLPAQRAAIEAAYPIDYYQPALLLRVGLFVATLLSVGSALLALGVLGVHSGLVLGVLALAGSVAGVEAVIKNARHYHSGVDMALLYSALLAWNFLILYSFNKWLPYGYSHRDYGPHFWLTAPGTWLHLLLLLGPLLLALRRYADPVVAVATFGTALALLANMLLHGAWGRLLLPFETMAASAALLYWLEQQPARLSYLYYRPCLLVLRTLALAAFYLAGNYLIVREGNALLVGGYGPSPQVPLVPVFYVFTAVVPLLYLYLGLRRHDRLMLLVGVLAVAFSIFTVRYYRALMPPEVAASLAGLVLIGLALAALRYLRTPRHGLTAAPDDEAAPHFNLEALVVAQTASVPTAPATTGFQFGGGQSGGGGSESSF